QINQSLGNADVELFELAKIYLPRGGDLPEERWMLGLCSGRGLTRVKGVLESLAAALRVGRPLAAQPAHVPLLEKGASCTLSLGDVVCGVVGELTKEGLKQFGLRSPTTVAELWIDLVGKSANFVPQHRSLSPFPAIEQDLNVIVDESVRWADLEAAVRGAGGELLESVAYRETYRNAQADGAGKKRLMFSVQLRSHQATLTGEQAESVREAIVAACGTKVGAKLLG
ncbi:MAG: hypothetical protein KDA41_16340, partial [Planctomycetales bacterium]|nr:hypothetical protein [Planctomycetales bacterium]